MTAFGKRLFYSQGLFGIACIVMAACMWGVLGPISKLTLAQGVQPMEIAFWRAVMGAGLFGLHAAMTGNLAIRRKDVLPLALFGFISVSVFYASYQIAIQSVGAALAAILLYTSPAWVGIFSYLLLKEHMSGAKILTIAVTILGAALVSLPDASAGISPSPIGIAAGLTAGFSYALYYIFGKKLLSAYPICTVFFYSLAFGALFLFPMVDFSPKGAPVWGLLFSIALVASYGAFFLYSMGLKQLESTKAVIIATLEPVVAVGISCTFMGEALTVLGWTGCVLILGAVLRVACSEQKTSRALRETASQIKELHQQDDHTPQAT